MISKLFGGMVPQKQHEIKKIKTKKTIKLQVVICF